MARPVIDEWSGERLVYLSPHEVCEKFGYPGPGDRADVTPAEIECFTKLTERVPLQDGTPSAERQEVDDPAVASRDIKSRALELGADLVGVTRVDPYYIYEGRDVPHRYAIVFAIAMDLEEIPAGAPRRVQRRVPARVRADERRRCRACDVHSQPRLPRQGPHAARRGAGDAPARAGCRAPASSGSTAR